MKVLNTFYSVWGIGHNSRTEEKKSPCHWLETSLGILIRDTGEIPALILMMKNHRFRCQPHFQFQLTSARAFWVHHAATEILDGVSPEKGFCRNKRPLCPNFTVPGLSQPTPLPLHFNTASQQFSGPECKPRPQNITSFPHIPAKWLPQWVVVDQRSA
jgi:hypothetical protein